MLYAADASVVGDEVVKKKQQPSATKVIVTGAPLPRGPAVAVAVIPLPSP